MDDCKYYEVSKEKLIELQNLCKEVIEKSILKDGKISNGQTLKNGEWEDILEEGKYIENKEVAEKLLPTTRGCFFGSTDYDEYYIEDLENTIKIIDDVLKETDFEKEYILYMASW